ncbi:MAG: hypothetical protein RLZZ373_3837 [Pseudomonadota bacterium]
MPNPSFLLDRLLQEGSDQCRACIEQGQQTTAQGGTCIESVHADSIEGRVDAYFAAAVGDDFQAPKPPCRMRTFSNPAMRSAIADWAENEPVLQ